MAQDLKVVLSLVDDFSKHLTGIETNLGTFGRKIDGMVGTVTKLAGAFASIMAVGQIKSFIDATIEYGDNINDMAARTGLTIEKVQELSIVAKQSGTEIGNLQKAFKDIAIKAYENSKAFEVLGISVKNNQGALKDTGTIFEETIIKLAEIPNVTERAAIANKIFGKGTSEVMGIVAQGADKIREMIKQAHDLGLILDEKTVRSLDDAKDKMQLLNTATSVLGAEMTRTFIPAISNAALAVAKFFKALRGDDDYERAVKAFDELDKRIKRAQETGSKLVYIDPQLSLQPLEYAIKKLDELRVKKEALTPKVNTTPNAVHSNADFGSDKDKKPKLEKSFAEYRAEQTEKGLQKIYDKTAEKTKQRYANEKKALQDTEREKVDIIKKSAQDILNEAEKNHQRLLDQIDMFVSMGAEVGAAFASGMEDGKLDLKESFKGILTVFVDFLERWTLGVIAENTLKRFGQAGVPGLIVGAAEAAGAVAVFELAKAGIQNFAAGTRSAPGGWSMVGEHGPEMAYLQPGTRIFNNQDTRNMSRNLTVNIKDNSGGIVETFHRELRRGGQGDRLLSYLSQKLAVV